MSAPGCAQHDGERCMAVFYEATSWFDGKLLWEEGRYVTVEHLSETDAADAAEREAGRLSAHFGHIQWRRLGANGRTWKVWEPGPEKVEAYVRVIDHPDRWEQVSPLVNGPTLQLS